MAQRAGNGSVRELREIVGAGPSDEELESLLKAVNSDVQRAINLFYERCQPPPAAPTARGEQKQATLGAFAHTAPGRKRAHADVAFTPPEASADGSDRRSLASAPSTRRLGVADAQHKPLAERMRPRELEDLVGQEGALNELVVKAIELDKVPSLLLWGPPGCGTRAEPAAYQRSTPGVPLHPPWTQDSRPHWPCAGTSLSARASRRPRLCQGKRASHTCSRAVPSRSSARSPPRRPTWRWCALRSPRLRTLLRLVTRAPALLLRRCAAAAPPLAQRALLAWHAWLHRAPGSSLTPPPSPLLGVPCAQASAQSYSSMRYTASPRRSRTACSLTSREAPSP